MDYNTSSLTMKIKELLRREMVKGKKVEDVKKDSSMGFLNLTPQTNAGER